MVTYKPSLRHGDFGTGNILYNPQRQAISGIIDFGFAGLAIRRWILRRRWVMANLSLPTI
ncbi:MAG: phosphotransferase [Chloroflexi bacterium]|nr:phosphotransferase [Chloroflexota bacterium]